MKHKCGDGIIHKDRNGVECLIAYEDGKWIYYPGGTWFTAGVCPFCGDNLEKPLADGWYFVKSTECEDRCVAFFKDGLIVVFENEDNISEQYQSSIEDMEYTILRGPLDMDRYNEFPVKGE